MLKVGRAVPSTVHLKGRSKAVHSALTAVALWADEMVYKWAVMTVSEMAVSMVVM